MERRSVEKPSTESIDAPRLHLESLCACAPWRAGRKSGQRERGRKGKELVGTVCVKQILGPQSERKGELSDSFPPPRLYAALTHAKVPSIFPNPIQFSRCSRPCPLPGQAPQIRPSLGSGCPRLNITFRAASTPTSLLRFLGLSNTTDGLESQGHLSLRPLRGGSWCLCPALSPYETTTLD